MGKYSCPWRLPLSISPYVFVGWARPTIFFIFPPCPNALIVWGGWDGHQPEPVARNVSSPAVWKKASKSDFPTSLDAFEDAENTPRSLCLIVPNSTMGKITHEQVKPGSPGRRIRRRPRRHATAEWATPSASAPSGSSSPAGNGSPIPETIGPQVLRFTSATPSTKSLAGIADFSTRLRTVLHACRSRRNKVLATNTFPVAHGPHSPTVRWKCRCS